MFKNSASLASHKYRFHKLLDKSSNGSNSEVLLPNPISANGVSKVAEDLNMKDHSEELESRNENGIKRTEFDKLSYVTVPKLVKNVSSIVNDLDQVSKKLENLEKELERASTNFHVIESFMESSENEISKNKQLIRKIVGRI